MFASVLASYSGIEWCSVIKLEKKRFRKARYVMEGHTANKEQKHGCLNLLHL